jgi:hypothetical protein
MEEATKKGTKDYTFYQSYRNRLPPLANWKTYTLKGTCRKVNIEMLDNLELIG